MQVDGNAVFGAETPIHLSATVPEAFEKRLRARGATVVRAGEGYEASMAVAEFDELARSADRFVTISDEVE